MRRPAPRSRSHAARAALWAAVLALCAGALHADVGLRFARAPEPIAAPPGDDVVFECSLNVPAEQVRWRHAGRYLSPQDSSRLVVRVQSAEQTGDYQCVAWYGAAALASVPAHLSLAEIGNFSAEPDLVLEAFPGNTITIHCQAPRSNPPAVLQYFRDGRSLPESARVVPSTGSLIVPNVSAQDAGVYTCAASNYISTQSVTSQQRITLQVARGAGSSRAPSFLFRPPENYTVPVGSNVTLECAAAGAPSPTLSWRRLGGALPARAEQVAAGLRIATVSAADRGAYVCEASNGVGRPQTLVARLFPQEPPALLAEPPRTSVAEEGGPCELECAFSGEPGPAIAWILNGESVSNDSQIATNGGQLRISRLEKRHAGIYQCMASNALGAAYGAAMLQVRPQQVPGEEDTEGANNAGFLNPTAFPGQNHSGKKEHRHGGKGRRKDKKHKGNAVMIPPTKPHITRLSDESVMVRWHVPPNDGLPIQFFKVQYRELGNGRTRGGNRARINRWMTSNEDIPPHIRSYEVANLEADHTYRFRIAAVYSNNDNKLGPNSARFHLHRGSPALKTHLNAPLLIRTEAVSSKAIQIHWQYTPSAATPIEGFYVYYRATSSAGDYVKATVEGEQTRSHVITHLLSDTAYDIKLQSFTVGAASDFSAIKTHKTQRETTTPPPQVVAAEPSAVASHGQLYMVLGAVLGGLSLLVGLLFLLFLCNRQKQQSPDTAHSASHHNHETIDRDKPLEPVVNGFGMNGCGRMQPNGLLVHANTLTITGNPLEVAGHDKKHTTMEMTFLSSHTNNNSCSMSQRAAAAGSGVEVGVEVGALLRVRSSLRSVTAEEELDLERIPSRASENYV